MSANTYTTATSSSAVSLNIVTALEKYGQTTIPVDFVAKVVGRPVSDVRIRLDSLARQGVVKIVDDSVSLVKGGG